MSTSFKVVGHRGFPQRYPENSPAGLIAAAEAGAHAVELDVQISADGLPVVIHDHTLTRVTGHDGFVWDYRLAELECMSAHEPGRFGERFVPTPIASLASVCEALASFKIPVFIELKEQSLAHVGTDAMVAAVLDAASPLGSQAYIISFDDHCLERVRGLSSARDAANTALEIGWVLSSLSENELIRARQLAPSILITDVRKLKRAEDLWPGDWDWFIYDIVEPEQARQWAARGVSYIETWDCARLLA